MAAAVAVAARGLPSAAPNPNVGCVLVNGGRVVGRGWTAAGGRPHAEAAALAMAGPTAAGATAYVTLEPCAHASVRGPACADLLAAAGVARVVGAVIDPDPRTAGAGYARLAAAGVAVTDGVMAAAARQVMAPWWTRQRLARPLVTLKLALSLDGCIALASGASRWITGDRARAHAHGERARHGGILVGRGTFVADAPQLDVRLAGLDQHQPLRVVLTSGAAPTGWTAIAAPAGIAGLPVDSVLVEGGAQAAAAFVRAGLVDRLLIYRAPILIGGGRAGLADIGLDTLDAAHGRWTRLDSRRLGPDELTIFVPREQD